MNDTEQSSVSTAPGVASSPDRNSPDRPHAPIGETSPATNPLPFPNSPSLPEAAPEAATLSAAGRELVAASVAPNTRRAYLGALTRLADALGEDPLTDASLAGYLAGMFAAGRSIAAAKLVVAAVRFQARLAGQPSPDGPLVERTLRGYVRRGDEVSRRGQVAPIRWEQADAAAAIASNDRLRGLRDAALLAVMSDGLLRVSEAAALDVADLNAEDRTLTIRRGKTDQEGRGAVIHLGRPTLERTRAWLETSGVRQGALFRRVGKGGRVGGRLTDRSLRRIIQSRARVAGIEGRVSGHSLRVGSAQSVAAAGASLVEMQREGRWRSPEMPGLYTRNQAARRGATARLRYKE